jgi:hypothetical protein
VKLGQNMPILPVKSKKRKAISLTLICGVQYNGLGNAKHTADPVSHSVGVRLAHSFSQ